MDFGLRHPFVMLWAQLRDLDGARKRIEVIDEYVRSDRTLDEHVEELARRLWPHPAWIGVDPAGRQRSSQTGRSAVAVLQEAGYATAAVGKWGLQGEGDDPQSWPSYPTKRGFDYFLGYVPHRAGHNHYPAHEVEQRGPQEVWENEREISDQLEGCYTTDLFTAAAKRWIVERQEKEPNQPFFLYLAYDTPHAGLEVPATPYPDGAGRNGGLQWVGEPGRMINTADSSIDSFFHPDYRDATWDHDGDPGTDEKPWPKTAVRFATMVRRIDNGVGDLVQLLKDLGVDENTLIVFSSDNGPHRESYGYGPHDPTFFDSFGPLDGIKRDNWEGGTRMPTWARWPARIPERRTVNRPSQFHDWMATFADAAGLPAPARTDGVSLLPGLTGHGTQRPGTVYIEYLNNGSTPEYEAFAPDRRGRPRGQMQVLYLDGYKGIRTDIDSADDPFEIYDTRADPGERRNLAEETDRFGGLQRRMQRRVLQLRRPNGSAKRPYDGEPTPAVDRTATAQGLNWRAWKRKTPWTPDPASLDAAPAAEGPADRFNLSVRPRDKHIALVYEGLLRVPETGRYSFSLKTDAEAGAVMRLHDATVLDADRGAPAGSRVSGEIRLEAGLHPVELIYARDEGGEPTLDLTWEGPAGEGRIPEANLRRARSSDGRHCMAGGNLLRESRSGGHRGSAACDPMSLQSRWRHPLGRAAATEQPLQRIAPVGKDRPHVPMDHHPVDQSRKRPAIQLVADVIDVARPAVARLQPVLVAPALVRPPDLLIDEAPRRLPRGDLAAPADRDAVDPQPVVDGRAFSHLDRLRRQRLKPEPVRRDGVQVLGLGKKAPEPLR